MWPSVSETRVAEPEIQARPPPLYAAVDATTSWLPAGPTTARTFEFDLNDCATLTANARVDAELRVALHDLDLRVFLCLLCSSASTKNCAQRSCCWPIEAAGPVIGAATPIVRIVPHFTLAVAADDALAVRAAGPRESVLAKAAATITSARIGATRSVTFNFIPFPPVDVAPVPRASAAS